MCTRPTTTPRDREIAERLAQKHGIEIHALAEEMFAAKSDVSEFSDEQLLTLDSKEFEVEGRHLLISALETTTPEEILKRKAGLVTAIQKMKDDGKVDEVLLFIVDILKSEATVLVYNDAVKSIIQKSFGADVSGDTAVLPGIVSRKKQILPALKV